MRVTTTGEEEAMAWSTKRISPTSVAMVAPRNDRHRPTRPIASETYVTRLAAGTGRQRFCGRVEGK